MGFLIFLAWIIGIYFAIVGLVWLIGYSSYRRAISGMKYRGAASYKQFLIEITRTLEKEGNWYRESWYYGDDSCIWCKKKNVEFAFKFAGKLYFRSPDDKEIGMILSLPDYIRAWKKAKHTYNHRPANYLWSSSGEETKDKLIP